MNYGKAPMYCSACHTPVVQYVRWSFIIKIFKILSVLAAGWSATAIGQQAAPLPRLEIGVAAAGIQTAAYPSSSVNIKRVFAAPWLIYRSEKLEVKDGGVKLIAYQNDRLTIDLGISGSLSADTSETPIREGMPDIDFIFELGPRFDFKLSDNVNGNWRNRFNWVSAYRFALSTDFGNLDYRGPVASTGLVYRSDSLIKKGLGFNVALRATWAGNQLQDYFYGVDEEFVIEDVRPEFDANPGLLGVDLSAGVSFRPLKPVGAFIGLGYTSLAGAENSDSPLFEDNGDPRIILALSWRLYQSKKTVTPIDE